jgi:Cu(I)/Ag(I) efflux system membrane fusion protein
MEEMQRQLLAAARDRLNVHFGLTEEQIADLEETRDVRSSAVFHSPISGTVIEKPVLPGQYVDEGMVLYQLADLSRVWILLDIYEKDLRYVGKGQQVTIVSEAYPGEIFEGTVTFIDPVVSPETRTVRVRTEFANRGGKLKPNMFVTARVRHAIRDVLIIPSGAVLSTGERNVVWVHAGEDRFEPREVLLGARNDGSVEVLQGLSEGEMIASTGGFLIDSESSLRMPSGPDPHKGHGPPADGAGAVDGHATDTTEGNGVEDVHIRVKGGYVPEVVRLKRGVRAKLHFLREESSRCTEEVVIRKFGIRANLPQGEPVRIELTPDETGEFVFSCGMDMVHGKIVVHE